MKALSFDQLDSLGEAIIAAAKRQGPLGGPAEIGSITVKTHHDVIVRGERVDSEPMTMITVDVTYMPHEQRVTIYESGTVSDPGEAIV